MLHDAIATYEHSLRASVDMVSEHDFDAVVELLADSRRQCEKLGELQHAPSEHHPSEHHPGEHRGSR